MPLQEYPLPPSLPYPITITSLATPVQSEITRNSPLLNYSYIFAVPKRSGNQNKGQPATEKRIGTWEANFEGTVVKWMVQPGATISRQSATEPVIAVEQSCSHEQQYGGICLICLQPVVDDLDYNSTSGSGQAMVPMTHTAKGPIVSEAEAQRIVRADNRRLLEARKLSLIVDLDQTIVHATVDPTVGEWIAGGHAYETRMKARAEKASRKDTSEESDSDSDSSDENDFTEEPNPNWEALKDVSKFKLGPDGPNGLSQADAGCDYFIKPRPGLDAFLTKLSKKYEMHVYTMGTRGYAEKVCSVIDPTKNFFNNRILSRDDSGSLTRKSISRLFPYDDSMVVIIDDRSDVWENSVNLIKVIPYDFFVGIGDINATFLPKNTDPLATAPSAPNDLASQATNTAAPPSAPLTPSSALTAPTDASVTREEAESAMAAEAQSKAVEAQLEDRPLAKMQEALDDAADDEDDVPRTPPSDVDPAENGSPTTTLASNGSPNPPASPSRHKGKPLLKNDDVELDRVFKILDDIHERFFDEHEAVVASNSQMAGNKNINADVKAIIKEMKREVFLGVHLVFSGVIPMNVNPEEHSAWRCAIEFGAKCHHKLSHAVTHVIANKPGTDKVNQAQRMSNVKVVWAKWFYMSMALWNCLPITEEYLMENPRSSSKPPPSIARNGDVPPDESSTSEEEDEAGDEADVEELGQDVDMWKDLDKELEDFMDEDEDGDETRSNAGSVRGVRGTANPSRSRSQSRSRPPEGSVSRKNGDDDLGSISNSARESPVPESRKRRRRSSTPSGSHAGQASDEDPGSPLSKRKRLAGQRGTSSLKIQVTLEEDDEDSPNSHSKNVRSASVDNGDDSEMDDAADEMGANSASDDDSSEADLFDGIGDDEEWG